MHDSTRNSRRLRALVNLLNKEEISTFEDLKKKNSPSFGSFTYNEILQGIDIVENQNKSALRKKIERLMGEETVYAPLGHGEFGWEDIESIKYKIGNFQRIISGVSAITNSPIEIYRIIWYHGRFGITYMVHPVISKEKAEYFFYQGGSSPTFKKFINTEELFSGYQSIWTGFSGRLTRQMDSHQDYEEIPKSQDAFHQKIVSYIIK